MGSNHKLPVKEGYPDAGYGRYANKLKYEDWFKFNVGQRVHWNFIEHQTYNMVSIFVLSLRYNLAAAIAAILVFLLRIGYGIGYSIVPKLRFFSFIPLMLV